MHGAEVCCAVSTAESDKTLKDTATLNFGDEANDCLKRCLFKELGGVDTVTDPHAGLYPYHHSSNNISIPIKPIMQFQ